MKTRCATLMVVALTLCPVHAATRYVNLNNPTPSPPYTSWATAATTIQDAINVSTNNDYINVTNGVYTIGLQLFDGSNTVTGTTTLTVANAAPTIALAGNAAVNESTAYTLNLGAVTDAGDDAPTSYIVDWGDGSDPNFYTTLGNKIHTYADNGNVTISVTVVDEDGMHAAAGTKAVTVNNIAPAVISRQGYATPAHRQQRHLVPKGAGERGFCAGGRCPPAQKPSQGKAVLAAHFSNSVKP